MNVLKVEVEELQANLRELVEALQAMEENRQRQLAKLIREKGGAV